MHSNPSALPAKRGFTLELTRNEDTTHHHYHDTYPGWVSLLALVHRGLHSYWLYSRCSAATCAMAQEPLAGGHPQFLGFCVASY